MQRLDIPHTNEVTVLWILWSPVWHHTMKGTNCRWDRRQDSYKTYQDKFWVISTVNHNFLTACFPSGDQLKELFSVRSSVDNRVSREEKSQNWISYLLINMI